METKPCEDDNKAIILKDPEDAYISTLNRPNKAKEEEDFSNPFRKPYVKLVFFKCPDCMEIFARLIDLNNVSQVTCTCGKVISFDKTDLVFGSYECPDCGTTGKFLMQPTVPEIKCRKCINKFYMVQDSETKDFRGYKY